jgi:hypothetical protein
MSNIQNTRHTIDLHNVSADDTQAFDHVYRCKIIEC